MLNLQEIKYALKNLIHRKLRSFLSTLSIVLGIMSIFALVSFGIGITDYVNELAEEAGTDKLTMMAKSTGAPGTSDEFFFTEEEIEYVSKIKGVEEHVGMYMGVSELEFKDDIRYSFVVGMDPDKQRFIEESFTVGVEEGRALKEGDLKKVVLGYNYRFDDKIFKRGMETGDKLTINEEEYQVVGFYDEVGNPQDDSQVYLTDKAFELLYPKKKDKYGFVFLQAQKGVDPEELANKIQDKLRKFKGQEEGKEDFYVQTFSDALETFSSILNVVIGAIILIALISLVVAAINIMNTMYTAVLERTKEIGIMKAIGAKNSKITALFVFESGFLGLIGGIVGMFIGYIIAKIGGELAKAGGYGSLQPSFPPELIIGCMFFAFFIGILAGFLPAVQASRMKPVDALRYE